MKKKLSPWKTFFLKTHYLGHYLVLNWTDPDGDTYSKKFSSVQEMRKFFNEYPQLAKAIGSKKY
ncbi:MAG: hypothetical protein ACFB2Y_18390 [Fulvivirga sp.]